MNSWNYSDNLAQSACWYVVISADSKTLGELMTVQRSEKSPQIGELACSIAGVRHRSTVSAVYARSIASVDRSIRFSTRLLYEKCVHYTRCAVVVRFAVRTRCSRNIHNASTNVRKVSVHYKRCAAVCSFRREASPSAKHLCASS